MDYCKEESAVSAACGRGSSTRSMTTVAGNIRKNPDLDYVQLIRRKGSGNLCCGA